MRLLAPVPPPTALPTHPTLRGFGGFVFRTKPSWGRGVGNFWKNRINRKGGNTGERLGRSVEIGKNGDELGRFSVRVKLAFPLFRNLFLRFLLPAVSVVSYSTPNPVGEGALGASVRTG